VTAPADVARFVLQRQMVGLAIVSSRDELLQPPESVVLVGDDDASCVVDLRDERAARGLSDCLTAPARVCVFDSARAPLRRLLRAGVDVARPACITTMRRVLRERGDDQLHAARSVADAEVRARDALAALPELIEKTRQAGQTKVTRLENLVLRAFAALEDRGLPVQLAPWRALVDKARDSRSRAQREVFDGLGDSVGRDLFGEPDLSLDNDQEVKVALERLLGRTLDDVTKGTLAGIDHPVLPALLAYREAAKIVSTYGDAFLEHVDPKTERIHATFVPLGASTGRVSSREPNLQNLPSDEAFHRCVAPGGDHVVVTADYATCELRILAELSGDERFRDAFQRNEDLHSVVATRMFGMPVSKTENPHLRKKAKAINFGLVYGMGAAALGAQVGATLVEAEKLLDKYFEEFPRIRDHLEGSVDIALARGYAETVLGRRLRFNPETLKGPRARGELGRIAKNMPIQGTSADMTKLAMVRVHERLRADGFAEAGLINTIHDELVVECRREDGEAVGRLVEAEMGAAHETLLKNVPPKVEVVVADYWFH